MATDDLKISFLTTAATMRALAGGCQHQVTYAGTDTHIGESEVRLPAFSPTATRSQRASMRGAADGAAFGCPPQSPDYRKYARHLMVPERFSSLQSRPEWKPSARGSWLASAPISRLLSTSAMRADRSKLPVCRRSSIAEVIAFCVRT